MRRMRFGHSRYPGLPSIRRAASLAAIVRLAQLVQSTALAGVAMGAAACGSSGDINAPTSDVSASGSGGAASGATGTGSAGGSGESATGAWCKPIPACDAPPPDPGAKGSWNHTIESPIIAAIGNPNHRGRDLFLNPGDAQWIIGKFAYGLIDKDLKGENVDVYLLRDCGDTWEKLGTAVTTQDEQHPTVEGVDDSGGRLYFKIPDDKKLGLGRHRVHLVVQGDLSSTDLFLDVVPRKAPVFVTDVDGTLTDNENAEFGALLTGKLPGVHPDAAKLYDVLVSKGYHPMYLTARPEWLVGRTRELLDTNKFPPGIVHTTLSLTGATGDPAGAFKTTELSELALKGIVPAFGFGNTASDADAYENAHIPVGNRFFFQFIDAKHLGREIKTYTELLTEFEALPSLCR
jgi:LNS2 (Lipin/Ned1/Smp2)